MLLIEREQPDVAREAHWYLEPVDYLSMRFTGVAAASPASMFGCWLTDNRKPYRLEYDQTLIEMIGVPADKLAPLRATGSVIGVVAPAVAADLGLAPGVKVVTGVPDLHTAAAGSGAVRFAAWRGVPRWRRERPEAVTVASGSRLRCTALRFHVPRTRVG